MNAAIKEGLSPGGRPGERAVPLDTILAERLYAEQGSIVCGPVASDLGAAEGAVRVLVHRLRRRFREISSEAVAHTLASPQDLAKEMRHLMEVLKG